MQRCQSARDGLGGRRFGRAWPPRSVFVDGCSAPSLQGGPVSPATATTASIELGTLRAEQSTVSRRALQAGAASRASGCSAAVTTSLPAGSPTSVSQCSTMSTAAS